MNRVRQAYFWPIIVVLAAWVAFIGWRVAMGPEVYSNHIIEAAK